MANRRQSDAIQNKETAVERLTQDFIVALSRDYVEMLGGVDVMTAFVRATSYLRSSSPKPLVSSHCSPCDYPTE